MYCVCISTSNGDRKHETDKFFNANSLLPKFPNLLTKFLYFIYVISCSQDYFKPVGMTVGGNLTVHDGNPGPYEDC